MNTRTLALFAFFTIVMQNYLFSQDKTDFKFGHITPADFNLSKEKFDTGANAVVIADIGSSAYDRGASSYYIVFKKFKRVKILNKNGFDAADVTIPLYKSRSGSAEEDLSNLKATTYNLEDGKVVTTELDKKSIYKDKYDRNHTVVKFTLPSVKVGSIIEYSYVIKSDFFFNLQSWEFQGDYPELWSEYKVVIPPIFEFAFLIQGNRNFDSTNKEELGSGDMMNRWIMRNVPALKEENYTSTISNYIEKIDFVLSRITSQFYGSTLYSTNWTKIALEFSDDEYFGGDLSRNHGWLNDEMKTMLLGAKDTLEKAKRIFAYVRDHFTCTDKTAIYASNPFKTTWKNRNGSVADLNLLLITMLRHENITAFPVILSTRSNGFAHPFYPTIDQYNYVVALMTFNNKEYFLDASDPNMGFGHLPSKCYNGQARLMLDITAEPIILSPDSLLERKLTSAFLFKEKNKGELSGKFNSTLGYYESIDLRERIKKKGKEDFFKEVDAQNQDILISNEKLDSLDEKDISVQESYDFTMKDSGDVLYIKPMLEEGYKENWFKAAERNYPVEFPYAMDETYVLNMEIPEGYAVDEIPKSAKVSMGDGQAYFEYMIAKDEDVLRLRSRIQFKKATYLPEDYNELREFFSYIVKKHAEQIVLRKIK